MGEGERALRERPTLSAYGQGGDHAAAGVLRSRARCPGALSGWNVQGGTFQVDRSPTGFGGSAGSATHRSRFSNAREPAKPLCRSDLVLVREPAFPEKSAPWRIGIRQV